MLLSGCDERMSRVEFGKFWSGHGPVQTHEGDEFCPDLYVAQTQPSNSEDASIRNLCEESSKG